ncbi:hypothetical protein [Bacillus benzoevorans]|uniref:Uncharacterized protein n=1 Tax=Bacillus benzoevorans TaxID=1456 RepID=A0A7X0HTE1_9BACI|nr:hypothetical protein [Bacillus benzoevorans]MBB6445400.1 hypothetical protein [Bacillus benzoevorans]
MGILFTALLLFAIAAGIITLYEIAPGRIKREINELIEHIGAEYNERLSNREN